MEGQPITALRATETDVDEAGQILIEAARWLVAHDIREWRPEDFSAERVRAWIGALYIARSGAVPVGVFRLASQDPTFWPDVDPAVPAAILHSLAAAPSYRGQGTGLRLLELATAEARRDGAQVLRLDCWSANLRLRQYYEEAGFTYLDDMDVGRYRVSRFGKSLSE